MDEKDKDSMRQAVILAALMHDIGKFAQRAGEKLNEQEKNLAEICCPKDTNGYPTHLHAVLSGSFIEKMCKWGLAENIAYYHHYPKNYHQKILQLSDWLSCGERRDRAEGESTIDEIKKEPLISIFSQIKIDEKENKDYYCPVLSLSQDIDRLKPVSKKEEAISQNSDEQNSFEFQWKSFLNEAYLMKKDNPEFTILYSRLSFLLEKYTLFIPSSAYRDKPEISLYHHLKSTAAIATCIYDLHLKESEIDSMLNGIRNDYKGDEVSKERFLLVGGDISGIQDFIYSVTSSNALKGLRGRSFYLQLLSETVARYILDRFCLTQSNLLSCGGGHFSLLLPKTDDSDRILLELNSEVNEMMFRAHKGTLAIVLSSVGMSCKDFGREKYGSVLDKLGKKQLYEKRRKFKTLIIKNQKTQVFDPYEVGGEKKACEICGEELSEENRDKCSLCESFEELSAEIRRAKYIEIHKIEKTGRILEGIRRYSDIFEVLGYNYRFVSEYSGYPVSLVLNSVKFLSEDNLFAGFRMESFYSPEGTLEDIANSSDGIKKWGALRMDVDNLSTIFKEGLGGNTSISRINMLSYLLSFFFSVQIKKIAEEEGNRDKICVVYSGGDDLFILGSWSYLPYVAVSINDSFRDFVSQHPRITLSGGIYLAPDKKFPVYQAARESGEELKKAKKGIKNKITFFETPLLWEELKELSKIKDKIVGLIKPEKDDALDTKMPRALLTMLYSSWKDKLLIEQKKISMSRIWRLLYGLRRLVNRYLKDDESRMKLAQELRDDFIVNLELKQNLDIAVRWADYLTREEK